jgi:hypothetical protein
VFDVAILSLADLGAHDPSSPGSGPERDYLCPLAACAAKQQPSRHRSLSANVESGLWNCARCGATGKLREFWVDRPLPPRRRFPPRPIVAPAAPTRSAVQPLVDFKERTASFLGSPAEAYLRGRGIRLSHANEAGVRYAADWYGRPAVVFPIKDRGGRIVAADGRYLDDGSPKARTMGPKGAGAFLTYAALEVEPLLICEAPLDALSLVGAGFPTIALCGTSWPAWLAAAAAFRPVLLGLDNDQSGEQAAPKLAAALSLGSACYRLRPERKDWNDDLRAIGPYRLALHLAEQLGSLGLPLEGEKLPRVADPDAWDAGAWVSIIARLRLAPGRPAPLGARLPITSEAV